MFSSRRVKHRKFILADGTRVEIGKYLVPSLVDFSDSEEVRWRSGYVTKRPDIDPEARHRTVVAFKRTLRESMVLLRLSMAEAKRPGTRVAFNRARRK